MEMSVCFRQRTTRRSVSKLGRNSPNVKHKIQLVIIFARSMVLATVQALNQQVQAAVARPIRWDPQARNRAVLADSDVRSLQGTRYPGEQGTRELTTWISSEV